MNAPAWTRTLADRLRELPTAELGAHAVDELVGEAVADWAEDRGLDVRRYADENWLSGPVLMVLDSPSGKSVAVAVDHHHNSRSLGRLRQCAEHGWGTLWVRWDDPQHLEVDPVAVLALELPYRRPLSAPADALQARCPRCGAMAGSPCSDELHAERQAAADENQAFIALVCQSARPYQRA